MLTDHLLEALAVLLPLDCPACGVAVSRAPCVPCARELAESAAMTRRSLGPPDDPLEVVTGASYAGVVRRLVLALKEEGRTAAVRPLAGLLRPALRGVLGGSPAPLVAPPGSYASYVRRGIDPVALLVASAGGRLENVLRRTRTVHDQVGLGRVDRHGNLDGAFRARRSLARVPPVVLVDDVVTSGATLLELRRAVRLAGGTVRGAVALAGTPLRLEPLAGASR